MKLSCKDIAMRPATAGRSVFFVLLVVAVFANPVFSKESDGRMSNQRLGKIIKRLDAKSVGRPGNWQLSIDGVKLLVISDERANRMRIVSPGALVFRGGDSDALQKRKLIDRLMKRGLVL